jgi:hypothetical protein
VRLLATITLLANKKPSKGMGWTPYRSTDPSQVWPNVVGRTEARSSNEGDITAGTNRTVSREDGLVEVLEGVMTTSTPTGPLKDDGEVRVRSGNVNDLSDAVNGARLGRDMLDTSILGPVDDFNNFLSNGNASGNAEAFDLETLLPHLLPERKLESELPRHDSEVLQRETGDGRHGTGSTLSALKRILHEAGLHGNDRKTC